MNQETLQKFCLQAHDCLGHGRIEIDRVIGSPFICLTNEDYVCATNRRILLAVKAPLEGVIRKVKTVIPVWVFEYMAQEPDSWLDIPRLPDGIRDAELDSPDSAPYFPPQENGIRIQDNIYAAGYLWMMREWLTDVKVCPVHIPKTDSKESRLLFKFDGGRGILMPLRKG